MWYDTNKLKDLNNIKVIITKRKRKKRNEKKHNENEKTAHTRIRN